MTVTYDKSFARLKRFLDDYKPQLEKSLSAINILEKTDSSSDEFCDALAELHVCATLLESYSEGVLEAINRYTDETSA
jgi:hypothetical protein